MQTAQPDLFRVPGRALRVLDLLIAVATTFLALATVGLVLVTLLGEQVTHDAVVRVDPVEVDLGPVDVAPQADLIEDYSVGAKVELPDGSWVDRLRSLGLLAANLVPAWLVLWPLTNVLKAARNGHAFHPINVRRFQFMGLGVAAYWLLGTVAAWWVNRWLGGDVELAGPAFGFWTCLLVALGLGAMAELVRQGATGDRPVA